MHSCPDTDIDKYKYSLFPLDVVTYLKLQTFVVADDVTFILSKSA